MKFKAILFALLVSLGVSASATASTVTPVPGEAHVQNIGWMPQTTQTIGTTGRALRLEAVRLYGFRSTIRRTSRTSAGCRGLGHHMRA